MKLLPKVRRTIIIEYFKHRNDVLTTCKAVTERGGQLIITVFFPQYIFLDFLEARREPAEEMGNA